VKTDTSSDVAAYIASFPPPVRRLLKQLRATIRKAAPKATETISYRMPAYVLNGPLVYFAGYARHVGFYPTGSGIEAFKAELGAYTWSRGAVQFPLDQPLPLELVRKMVEHRLQVNLAKAPRTDTGPTRRPSATARARARRARR
jgi:uncharacterized protein YdhG (YjbR/CyaY superfamily)